MLFLIVIGSLFIMFLLEEQGSFRRLKEKCERDKENMLQECSSLKKAQKALKNKVGRLEDGLPERFLFYDLTRKIAPILDKEELLSFFAEEIKHLGEVDTVRFTKSGSNKKGILKFELDDFGEEVLEIGARSKNVAEHIPYFVKLLRLCLERIKLYDELQELSILDSLTKVYNRRYFMGRYKAEFKRAEEFKFNLAFLMFDIDHFKKINDTYGHLVGDAVLREVARIIRDNLREIDFLARFGGEEFSVVLPETDKASAIMAAERISAKVSRERIMVFDEILSVNVSAGVATFPQNSLHPDVLCEVADKALYKAKLSGRNRVCWF